MSRAPSHVPKVLIIVLITVLVIPSTLPAIRVPAVNAPEPGVVDPVLADVLATSPPDEVLDVIVRFESDLIPADDQVLDDLGIHKVGEYRMIPAMHLQGRPSQIERLSGYPRMEWMEWDAPLDYLMDTTTTIVNATDTWKSVIEGSLWGGSGIDGKGVTAVILDTGIDAGHPDLDYGTKTIRNLKSDTGTGPFYEIENGDTSSGHGTHCAGTVAGNGDASAGARAGMAPGANLIGISTGEAGAITGAVGALQWVYEHSQPGNNPYNIRVVSNSWGAGGGIYEPGDSISEAINKLLYENNVVCCFAAGNSGGDGNTIQSGNYANTPAAICVAASGHEGTYITDFSSKGRWDWLDTYPDVAAPGHHINSTAARRTQISAMTQQGDSNPYYLAISGTSMATPHVSGLVALLWQAAPSMRVSDVHQDAGVVRLQDGRYEVIPPEELSTDDERYDELYAQWNERPDTRIHEAELIIKLTADMIPSGDIADPSANNLTGNWIPDWSVPGYAGDRMHDWSQGYGLINANRAVGLALTLERLRWDYPEATVLDAYEAFESIFEVKEMVRETDRLQARWSGEWSRFNEQSTNPTNLIFEANQTKYVYVPEGAEEVRVTLSWPIANTIDTIVGSLGFMIDFDDNGGWDFQSSISPELDGTRIETVSASGNDGRYWRFGIEGHAIKWHRIISQKQFKEARIEYEMSVSLSFGQGFGTIAIPPLDPHAIVADLKFAEPSEDYTMGNISMVKHVFNINNVSWQPDYEPPPVPETSNVNWAAWLLLLVIILIGGAYFVGRRYPDTPLGRRIRQTAEAVGVARALGRTKDLSRRTVRGVHLRMRGRKVVKAELVAEEPSVTDT